MLPKSLPAAPATLVHNGKACFGMYCGEVTDLNWSLPGLGRFSKRLHHKRWQYAAIAAEDYFIGVAIVDVGWTSSAFAYVFDRKSATVIAAYSAIGKLFGPTIVTDQVFGDCMFKTGQDGIAFARKGKVLQLDVLCKEWELSAGIQIDSTLTFASIAPANWRAHSTHKSGGLSVQGNLTINGKACALIGATASLDYSNGLLAHRTHWRWASAHAPGVGFNLQAGYMGAAENAIWYKGRLWPTGEANFDFDASDPLKPWKITSVCGRVNLDFTPEGARYENKNLIIAASRYVQPVGTFNGYLIDPDSGDKIVVEKLLGVTEDHFARW